MKRRIMHVMLLILVCSIGFVFYGCKDKTNGHNVLEQDSLIEINSETGALDAEALIKALKTKDKSSLYSMLKNDYNYEINEIEKIILCFENFYNLDTLRIEAVDSDNPTCEEYYFKIIGEKDNEKRSTSLTVKYDMMENETKTTYNHIFIKYFPYAEKTVDYYLKYLKKGDSGELSAFLSIDGGPDYFRAEAEELIKEFNNHYDMNSITYEYTGFARDRFVFNMRDQYGKSRDIHIAYGDGLVGVYEEILMK